MQSACVSGNVEGVSLNDPIDPEHLAHLLKYGSVHGPMMQHVAVEGESIVVDGRPVRVFKRGPGSIDFFQNRDSDRRYRYSSVNFS